MKKIMIKRLIYRNMLTDEISYGAEEYDGNLSDDNILGAIYTVGKHQWNSVYHHSLIQINNNGKLVYHVTVGEFERYQKSWYNLLFDSIKRILRI